MSDEEFFKAAFLTRNVAMSLEVHNFLFKLSFCGGGWVGRRGFQFLLFFEPGLFYLLFFCNEAGSCQHIKGLKGGICPLVEFRSTLVLTRKLISNNIFFAAQVTSKVKEGIVSGECRQVSFIFLYTDYLGKLEVNQRKEGLSLQRSWHCPILCLGNMPPALPEISDKPNETELSFGVILCFASLHTPLIHYGIL